MNLRFALPCTGLMRLAQNSAGSCADGLSRPSRSRGAPTISLKVNHSDRGICDGPDGPSPQDARKVSEPHFRVELSFATALNGPSPHGIKKVSKPPTFERPTFCTH